MNISSRETGFRGNTKFSSPLSFAVIVILIFLISLGLYWNFYTNVFNSEFDTLENQTDLFQGYEAYLDDRINYSGVHGSSMEPTFSENDKLLWVRVPIEDVEQEDIVIYHDPTDATDPDLIVHRVVGIENNDGNVLLETKGDNRETSDADTPTSSYYVSDNSLEGKVIGVIYSKD